MEQARVAAEGVLPLHVLWCAWVLLGWTVTRGRRVLRTFAHCFARVRDHYAAGSLAAVPAERDREPSRNSSRDRTRARTVLRVGARRNRLSRPAGMAGHWGRGDCLRSDPGCLFVTLSGPMSFHVSQYWELHSGKACVFSLQDVPDGSEVAAILRYWPDI